MRPRLPIYRPGSGDSSGEEGQVRGRGSDCSIRVNGAAFVIYIGRSRATGGPVRGVFGSVYERRIAQSFLTSGLVGLRGLPGAS